MESMEARLKTFEDSSIDPARAREFARCGFYRSGFRDEVCCAYCKVEIAKWQPDDSPLEEHLKFAPFCLFVQQLKPDRVKPKAIKPFSLQYRTEQARLWSFVDWPKSIKQRPEALAEAGFYYTGVGDKVKCFYCDGGLRDWEPDDEPWVQHARWFDKCDYVLTVKGAEYVQQAVSDRCLEKESKIVTNDEQPNNDTDPKNESKLCKICFGEQANVCFVPCGHIVLCAKCAFSINKTCPMCREPFDSFVRVYFS